MLKIGIERERLVLQDSRPPTGSWERDWDAAVLPALEDSQPCFILYRLDGRTSLGHFAWLLISWSPDTSPVRQKMLYASTKATLKMEFGGGGQIKEDLYGNVREDVSLAGYRRHLASAAAPGPLSREEMEREEVKAAQNDVAISVDSRRQTGLGGAAGLLFPMSAEADAALDDLMAGRVFYVQLGIDTSAESVELRHRSEAGRAVEPRQLVERTPKDAPRYHVLVFRYSHEGDAKISTIFLYTVPGGSIKEKMLYSSCKNGK